MIFQEYERLKKQFDNMQKICEQILTEKEKYFTRTQPNAIRYDKVSVTGGKKDNCFDEYLAECEKHKINQRLDEAIKIMQARGELLRLKEIELRASKDLNDIIYTMKFLDHAKPKTIAMALGYSESQIYRILEKMRGNSLHD